ncbi:MAG: prepilin peptidase [Candidatus Altiarchaeota archaeon]
MLVTAVIWVTLLFLILDSIIDLKTGEIPEKLTHGLTGIIILLAVGHGIIENSISMVKSTILVGASYFIAGYVLYRLGQWGGGDVKMMAGIGCALGYLDSMGYAWPNSIITGYYLTYFINMSIFAIPYAVTYSLILGFMNPSVFREFLSGVREFKVVILLAVSFAPALLSTYFGESLLALVYLMLPFFMLATIYLKVVEKKLLCKTVRVEELRVGDIPAEDIQCEGERIASKMIEGITGEELERITRLAWEGRIPDEVKIRWGIKFAPILLASYVMTLWQGSLLEIFFNNIL